MLDTSKSVSSTHSVTISRTKSILDLGTAVKSILFGAISSSVDTKKNQRQWFLSELANGLNFFFGLATRDLFFLPRSEKSPLSKLKSLFIYLFIYWETGGGGGGGKHLVCMIAIHSYNWYMMDLLNHCDVLLPLETL